MTCWRYWRTNRSQEDERLEARLRILPGCLDKLHAEASGGSLQVRYDGRATVAQIAARDGLARGDALPGTAPGSEKAASLHRETAGDGGTAMTDADFRAERS